MARNASVSKNVPKVVRKAGKHTRMVKHGPVLMGATHVHVRMEK
jgi:hypothetical protein